jgi:NADH-quinone oxidoreductase subunit G
MFYLIKDYLKKNNKISNEWNSLNKLTSFASTVGCLDLNIFNDRENMFDDLNNHKFDIVYLLGQDNLNFSKKDEFIIYQGSHGDKGAEMADIILPGAAYTEQNGYFTNLEGKLQKAYKASYPPGEAKEDWQIINELAEFMNNRKLFNDKDELESSMLNFINLKKDNKNSSNLEIQSFENFKNEELIVDYKDYYFSNVIARASKTMLDCHNSKIKIKKTGTDG